MDSGTEFQGDNSPGRSAPCCPAISPSLDTPDVSDGKGATVPAHRQKRLRSCLGGRRMLREFYPIQFNEKPMTKLIPRERFKARGEGSEYSVKITILDDTERSRPTRPNYSGSNRPLRDSEWKQWRSLIPFACTMARTRALELAEGNLDFLLANGERESINWEGVVAQSPNDDRRPPVAWRMGTGWTVIDSADQSWFFDLKSHGPFENDRLSRYFDLTYRDSDELNNLPDLDCYGDIPLALQKRTSRCVGSTDVRKEAEPPRCCYTEGRPC